ncbi:Surface-anchored NAD dependent sugar epimerase [Alteracholeplasma palmae J233]|uniref:Surface-anchored NAD dependent sugar epimerase n=1 Tax=Alteracholeplasma palmae (strain ATCC 49389 / J233) TaxID=1318466 RepID=U4KLC4_ALTPJ|nr:nucleoside-diphosphate sugar epimerase/dehydratase [Alteracholeplasma palmae]CCV64719.1 Surface-anchored NAD dependent sugar epimerase [Alteracholeplasma palmae J233]
MKNTKKIRVKSALPYIVFDIFMIIISYASASLPLLWIPLAPNTPTVFNTEKVLLALPFILALHIVVFIFTSTYRVLVDYFGFEDFIKLILIIIGINITIVLFLAIFSGYPQVQFIYKSSYISITVYEIILLPIPRILNRLIMYVKRQFKWGRSLGNRTLIIGAGYVGERVLKEIYKNKNLNNLPVAFLDDNKEKIGNKLMGIKVVGSLESIEEAILKYGIEEIIVAINHFPNEEIVKIANIAIKNNIQLKKFTGMEDVQDVKNEKVKISKVKIQDLLNRSEISLKDDSVNAFIKDEIVLVTGGGGSIGSELCRQISQLNPKQLVIFDIYENNAYDIQQELLRKFKKEGKVLDLKVIIGSVYNYERIKEVFETYRPTLVFHAAAYKHVPLMEDSAKEAVRSNVLGTYNVSSLANLYNVKKFVLVSSDKAVRSTNVMGATKRFAELVIQEQQSHCDKTKFSSVRFGNVLGSNGSVIPLFEKQIADGGPITVTHPEITRYFMTIPEAVGLILQCAVFAEGGEVFVLDMGEPVKIADLARKMISLSGLRPDIDIKVEFTGLRPGEKLYEELLVDVNNDDHHRTENKKIFIEKQRNIKLSELKLDTIAKSLEQMTNDDAKEFVASVVKTYTIKK